MTSHDTPTTTEATSSPAWREGRSTRKVATRTRDAQRPPDPRPSSNWLVWVGIVAALAAAIGLVIAGMADQYEAARSARADGAYSARLQGLADQYEAARSARADRASSARLQGLADQYEAARSARADRAYSARLQGLADQYEAARRIRANQASSARLQELADQYQSPSSRVSTGWLRPLRTGRAE